MRLPLLFVLERLGIRDMDIPDDIALREIEGIRALTNTSALLEPGYLYVGDTLSSKANVDSDIAVLLTSATASLHKTVIHCPYDNSLELLNHAISTFSTLCVQTRRIRSVALEQKGLDVFVELVTEIMGNPSYIADKSFKVLAIASDPMAEEYSSFWRSASKSGYLPYHLVDALWEYGTLDSIEACTEATLFKPEPFNNPYINYNLLLDGKPMGYLLVVGYRKAITQGEVAYLNILGKYATSALDKDMAFSVSRGRYYENFFAHMLSGALTEERDIINQLEPLGWDINGTFSVIRIKQSDDDEIIRNIICNRVEVQNGVKPLIYESGIVAILSTNVEQLADTEEAIESILREFGCRGGISDAFSGFRQVTSYYTQACNALKFGNGRKPLLCSYRHIAIDHLLSGTFSSIDAPLFIDQVVYLLQRYDRKKNTNYLYTLTCYLDNERNAAATASQLFIHRNTLIYRLKKIKEVLQSDLDDCNVRLRIHLTCRFLLENPEYSFSAQQTTF